MLRHDTELAYAHFLYTIWVAKVYLQRAAQTKTCMVIVPSLAFSFFPCDFLCRSRVLFLCNSFKIPEKLRNFINQNCNEKIHVTKQARRSVGFWKCLVHHTCLGRSCGGFNEERCIFSSTLEHLYRLDEVIMKLTFNCFIHSRSEIPENQKIEGVGGRER